MPKNGRRKSKASGRRNPQVVASLSLSQVWDSKLARTKDACHLSDRVAFAPFTATSTFATTILPSPIVFISGAYAAGALGQRVFNIGQNYLRYRINRLLACYRPVTGTSSSGIVGIGFADDPFPASTQQPGTFTSIEGLRCSHADSIYREIEVEWRPIDPKKWYFVDPDPSTSQSVADQRLEIPVSLYASMQFGSFSTATAFGALTLYYDITFEGADDSEVTGLP